jgi:hypothetical protein
LQTFYLEPVDATYLAANITINKVGGLLIIDSGDGQSLLHSDSLPLLGITERRKLGCQENYRAGGRFQVKRYLLDSYLVADKDAGYQRYFSNGFISGSQLRKTPR